MIIRSCFLPFPLVDFGRADGKGQLSRIFVIGIEGKATDQNLKCKFLAASLIVIDLVHFATQQVLLVG